MPIFDQGYQHWNGRLSGHAFRWLAITRQGVRQQIQRRRTKWLVAAAFVPALMLAALLVFWGLLEQQSVLIQPFMAMLQFLPEEVRAGPKAYRLPIWTIAFNTFFRVETFFAMLLVLTVGPDLVSQDLRFNAMPLYFSRPLRRIDYFLGKLGVIGVFLSAVAIGPAVAAYLLGVAFSLDVGVLKDTWRLLAGSVAYGLIVVLSAGTLMLAISSLSRNSRLVGAAWIGLWMISNFTSLVLSTTTPHEWSAVVSYTANLDRLREVLLDVAPARKTMLDLWKLGRERENQGLAGFLRLRGGRPRRPPPPPPRRRRFGDAPFPDPSGLPDHEIPPFLGTPEHVRHPWPWSAELLGGLFVLSAVTLSTRVKSMDRLR